MFFMLAIGLLASFCSNAQLLKLDNTNGRCTVWVIVYADNPSFCSGTYVSNVIMLPPGAGVNYYPTSPVPPGTGGVVIPWSGTAPTGTVDYNAVEFFTQDPTAPMMGCTVYSGMLGGCMGASPLFIPSDPGCNTCDGTKAEWLSLGAGGEVAAIFK